MSLQDPTAKMSKTDPKPANYIALLDEPDILRRKISRAVADAGSEVAYDSSSPGISNLLTIYSALCEKSSQVVADQYAGAGYGKFKEDLAETVIEFLRPIRKHYDEIIQDRAALRSILRRGANAATVRAAQMLEDVYERIGLLSR